MTIQLRIICGLYILFNLNAQGQRNTFSVDSFLRLLPGSWSGMRIECKSMSSDSTKLRIVIKNNHFKMTRISKGAVLSEDIGTFSMDTARAGGYRMTVLLEKEYPQFPYNALLLNLDVFDKDKILLSLFEGVYVTGNFHVRNYPGNYQLYKDEEEATTR